MIITCLSESYRQKVYSHTLLWVLLLFLPLPLLGQETSLTADKQLQVIPFPNIGYAPETGLYFGGVALFTWHPRSDTLTKPSKVKPEINYSLQKQLIISLEHDIHTYSNNWYFSGYNAYLKYPESFWGIGNNMPDSNEELFTARQIIFRNYFYRKINESIYTGLIAHIHSLYDLKADTSGLLATEGITGAEGGLNAGVGLSLLNDVRENIFTPSRGYFIQFSAIHYNPLLQSDFHFTAFELDIRKYFSLFNDRTFAGQPAVLAFQFFTKKIIGDAPFNQLALLGSDSHMRGYYTGRYRGHNYVSVQWEYRMMVWKLFGFAVFAGAGDVVSTHLNFSASDLKYSIGTGLRVQVDKKNNVNLRFDYAMGVDGNSGFYVAFGEAF